MSIKGTKTEKNLMTAFAGESQAITKYGFYASQAKKEGYEQISEIFTETVGNERAHAKMWFKLIHDDMPKTEENLKEAMAGESYEYSDMYAQFAEEAREEGLNRIAYLFDAVGLIEDGHNQQFSLLLDNIKENKVFEKSAQVTWRCMNCGYENAGTIAPKVCPICEHPQGYFKVQSHCKSKK